MKILMVSTEYPPMKGGVGRYTEKLVESLRTEGLEVAVVCNECGSGDFTGLSPYNRQNSEILRRAVKEFKPDVVHIQYEQGLYGIHLDPINPKKTGTNIESFYRDCEIPIVTTFHSAYTFNQWMKLIVPIRTGRLGKTGILFRTIYDYWIHLLNYYSFHSLNKEKIGHKRAGIVFSKYLQNLIPGSYLIYHGSEPNVPPTDMSESRKKFLLPEDVNIALAFGFMTATKGWDIIEKMKVPKEWKIVVNTSKNHYSKETAKKIENAGVIDLNRGFINDRELSVLLYSADALILPYKVSSASGVLYDGLSHGLPFISSKLEFFNEFSDMGLGISVDRNPAEFSSALLRLKKDYKKYKKKVLEFRRKLLWKAVTSKHIVVYNSLIDNPASILHQKILD